jgi:multidrug transporter EmrE-like cation transporter
MAALWGALIACDTGAQLAFKSAAINSIAPELSLRWLRMLAQSWQLGAAVGCLALTFLLWMTILRHQKLSTAFPATALAFVTVAAGSRWIYGETLPAFALAGIALILAGVAMLKPLNA